jgi:hypothetical protein
MVNLEDESTGSVWFLVIGFPSYRHHGRASESFDELPLTNN